MFLPPHTSSQRTRQPLPAAIVNKSTDRTSSPRYKITLSWLRCSLKPWAQCPTQLNLVQLKWLSWAESGRALWLRPKTTQRNLHCGYLRIHNRARDLDALDRRRPLRSRCKEWSSCHIAGPSCQPNCASGEADTLGETGGVAISECIHMGLSDAE